MRFKKGLMPKPFLMLVFKSELSKHLLGRELEILVGVEPWYSPRAVYHDVR